MPFVEQLVGLYEKGIQHVYSTSYISTVTITCAPRKQSLTTTTISRIVLLVHKMSSVCPRGTGSCRHAHLITTLINPVLDSHFFLHKLYLLRFFPVTLRQCRLPIYSACLLPQNSIQNDNTDAIRLSGAAYCLPKLFDDVYCKVPFQCYN